MTKPIGWMRAAVVDAEDYRRRAEFWAAVLGVEVAIEEEDWIQLEPDPGGAYLAFQPIGAGDSRGPTMRARPDIEVTDVEAARARVLELGGSEVRVVVEPKGDVHPVMADPEGNEFCLVLPLPPELQRERWGDGQPG